MERIKGNKMISQVINLIKRGFLGFSFGFVFYLMLSIITNHFLSNLISLLNTKFPNEKPIIPTALYAIYSTISMGLRLPFNALSSGESLMLTSLLFGTIGTISFIILGIKKGMKIFIIIFLIFTILLACPGFGMIYM